jgi:hypothetical protein
LEFHTQFTGKQLEYLQKRYAETGILPKPLQDEPELYQDLYPVWEGYWLLKGSLTDPLKFSDMIAYWKDVVGMDSGELHTVLKFTRKMDEANLKVEQERAIRNQPKNSSRH